MRIARADPSATPAAGSGTVIVLVAGLLTGLLCLGGCSGPTAPEHAASSGGPDDAVARNTPSAPATNPPPASGPAPGAGAAAAPAPVRPPDLSPLANLMSVSPGVLSGGMPRGDEGFSGLAGLGVTTIISVDAAAPDLARAKAHGMRSVHVPTRYATVTEAEQAAVARAIAEAEGTVYIHCHHGKHRGPAAAAAALRCLDRLTPEEAEAFLADAGTSPRYPGLWDAVRRAQPRDEAALLALAPTLVERAEPASFVVAMADLDRHWDNLRLLAARDWAPDPDHPDLAPAAEAGILADLFRSMAEQDVARTHGRGFVAELEQSADLAATLESLLDAAEPDGAAARATFDRIAASCASCHRAYRDTEG